MNVGQSNAAYHLRDWLAGDGTITDDRALTALTELINGASKRLGVYANHEQTRAAITNTAWNRNQPNATQLTNAIHFLWGFIHGSSSHTGEHTTCTEAGCAQAREALEAR